MTGKVYLVGSGPGCEDLLTQRGRTVIDSADVVLFDQLPGEEILSSLPLHAEKIDCGKYGGKHTLEQDEIEALMVDRARKGKVVVRLKGGDPFLFGRGGEELETVRKAGIAVEMVPGISSALAVPASVGIPLTHRSYASQVTILTATRTRRNPSLPLTGSSSPGAGVRSLFLWAWPTLQRLRMHSYGMASRPIPRSPSLSVACGKTAA
jgi:uroporphyrin-III C-methyltransferase